jgi:hypothetical protein
MNGCRYCVIIHNRKRRGRKRARGVAMCLAQEDMTRCHVKWDERGPGCAYHDAKVNETNHDAVVSQSVMSNGDQRRGVSIGGE